MNIVAGPDEYLFGEEKAMLEVIEGKPPLPRWFPPYEHGLFAASPQEGWEAAPHGTHRRTDEPNPTSGEGVPEDFTGSGRSVLRLRCRIRVA